MISDKRRNKEKTITKNDISGLILASLFLKNYDFLVISVWEKNSNFIHM